MNRDRILTLFTVFVSIFGILSVKYVSADSSLDDFEELSGRYAIEGKYIFFVFFFNLFY